jgi:hypothetical protein
MERMRRKPSLGRPAQKGSGRHDASRCHHPTNTFFLDRASGPGAWGRFRTSRLRRGGLPAQTVALLRGTDAPASLCLI